MKKLMTVLASAATALFAIGVAKGDGFVTQGINFEVGYSAGDVFDAQKDDAGGSTGDKFWYSTAAAGEIGDISNSTASVGKALVPDFFNPNEANSLPIGNYLHIDASAPLFRTAVANVQGAKKQEEFFSPTNNFVTPVDIGDGIYLDTLVQFTAADDAFQTDLDTGDKIAISYVEHEDDDTTAEVNEAWTNFVIRAGANVEGQFGQENYLAAVPAGFEKDAWHRLTVRTIKNVGDGQVGFVIYLDGDMTKTLNFTNEVNTGFTAASLNSTAKGFYDNHALYPSAVASAATGGTTISAASFSGTGALDDVVFTATKPSFIQEAAQVTITWDSDVTGIEIAGVAATQDELTAGRKTIVLDGPVTITITAITQGKEPRFATSGSGVWNGTSYTGLAAGDTVTITSIVPAFEIGGVRYTADELTDVVTAAAAGTSESPATIKLLNDCNQALAFGEGYIILDLAGNDIQGNGSEFSIGNAGATLVITNSGAEASVMVPADNGEGAAGTGALMAAAGTTIIQAGTFEGVIVTPAMTDEELNPKDYMVITGGKFLDAAYDPEDAESPFYLAAYVADGVGYEKSGDYVIVGGSVVPPVQTFALTTTGGANATVTTDPANVSALTGATEVTITATANANYTYAGVDLTGTGFTYDSENDAITWTQTVSEATEVVVPGAVAEVIGTYTVNVTTNANATYAAAYKDGGAEITPANDVLTVTVGKTIVITATPAEGYEYKSAPEGWTLSEGVLSIEVSEAGTVTIPAPTAKQQGGYPTYIEEIEDATVKAAYEAKYDTWKVSYGADAESAFGTAFLLNIAPNAADQTLEPASITIADGKVVITANKDLGAVNGKVYVKTAATLAGLETAEWAAATLDATTKAINVTQGSTDTAGFYQIKVDF